MKKSFAPLFIFVLLAIVSCGSPRYASSVVTTKVSDIPEFAFLKPCAYMVLYDTDGGYYNQDNTDIATDVIRPSAEECRINPRSKSTKMRWAIMSE